MVPETEASMTATFDVGAIRTCASYAACLFQGSCHEGVFEFLGEL